MAEKTKVEYTAEQKEAVLKRVKELDNVKKAAEEAGVPWQLVSMWRKDADPSATKAAQKAKKDAAKADKPKEDKTKTTAAKNTKADKAKTDTKKKTGTSAAKTKKAPGITSKTKNTLSESKTAAKSTAKTTTKTKAPAKTSSKTSKAASAKKSSKPAAKSSAQSKSSVKTNAKNLKSLEVSIKKDTPTSKLQIENAILRTENNELKKQVARLQKAVRELM